MTIDQITQAVSAEKPTSKRQIIRYMNDCDIKPLPGARTRPRRYPDNSPNRILAHLGLRAPLEVRFEADSAGAGRKARIPTMPELRNERRKVRGK